MMYWVILIALYFIAGLIGLKVKALSYGLVAFTAVLTLFFICYGYIFTGAVRMYFIIISSLAWLFISLFSIGYDRKSGILASTFAFTTAMMLIIMLSKDAFTFLIGWEGMTVASFFSLYEHKNSRNAAYMFLAFGELSFLLILSGFVYASIYSGTVLFKGWSGLSNWTWIYFLIVMGFIIKMAAVPFHIWLPEAHSKAPANMSAQLSAVMTLMGVYGIVFFYSTGTIGIWIGGLLLFIGGSSALFGAYYAAICDHVKRLPAYSTIENDGILIALSGAFIVVHGEGYPVISAFVLISLLYFAFAHTTAKSLLFIVAGKLEHSGGEYFGGDFKITRSAAVAGYIASLSLAGIPPLPGFVAEWAAIESMFQSFYFSNLGLRVLTVIIGALVALTVGISTIAMSKFIVHGVERGKREKPNISDTGLLLGSAILVFIGALPSLVFILISPSVERITGISTDKFLGGLFGIPHGYLIISGKGFGLLSPSLLLIFIVFTFVIVYIITRYGYMKKIKFVNPWSGGLSNDEYPIRGHSSILLHTQKWIYNTRSDMGYTDKIHNFYMILGNSVYTFSGKFQRALMPGNDRRYVLYILLTLLIFILISII